MMFSRLVTRFGAADVAALRVPLQRGAARTGFRPAFCQFTTLSARPAATTATTANRSFWLIGVVGAAAGLTTVGVALADSGKTAPAKPSKDAKPAKPAEAAPKEAEEDKEKEEPLFLEAKSINPKEFTPLEVIHKKSMADNATLYLFSCKTDEAFANPCYYLLLRANINGEEVIRPYTPIAVEQEGFALLIKDYPEGKLSKKLKSLEVHDTVEVKGPMPKIAIKPNMKKEIGLIAGGSGITPMYQLLHYLALHPEDKTKITLIYANVQEKDIWLRRQLERHAESDPRIKVHYVLEKPPANWTGSTGYVSKETVQKLLPKPSADAMIFVCGPPGMMKAISGEKTKDYKQGELSGMLKELGYTSDQVFKF